MSDLQVHPVADLFPMLAEDELAELAEDIKQRGLLQPIVLDQEGRVLDGRNRLAACELAGVEPTFETYEGSDPNGYALAVNVARRHLSKGQMAMIATDPKSLVSKDWGSGVRLSGLLGVSETLLSQARTTWKHAPDLAEQVVAGLAHLDEAYPVAVDNKRRAIEREQKLARIAAANPDMAVLVREKRLSIDQAIGAIEADEERARQEAEAARRKAEAEAAARKEREKREAALSERVAKLPADIAERVTAGTLDIAEAETVVQQRDERMTAWTEKVRAALETLVRMAGNPVPDELAHRLTDKEAEQLRAVVAALDATEGE